jgi:hypothetical protein
MADQGRQIIQLYMAFSFLMSLISMAMLAVFAFLVLSHRRASTERTLIGIGVVLLGISAIASAALNVLPMLGINLNTGNLSFVFYAVLNLISVVGTGLSLFGVIKLLRRNALLEAALEDQDDDR